MNNGDGTWTFNYTPVPSESIEYQIYVDGVGEDLLQEMIDGGTCAPLTDLYEYANRQWVISDGEEIFVTYNTCLNCDGTENISEVNINFGIYPNPSTDKIIITDSPETLIIQFFLLLVKKSKLVQINTIIDISQLDGVYFLSFRSENEIGKVSFVKE